MPDIIQNDKGDYHFVFDRGDRQFQHSSYLYMVFPREGWRFQIHHFYDWAPMFILPKTGKGGTHEIQERDIRFWQGKGIHARDKRYIEIWGIMFIVVAKDFATGTWRITPADSRGHWVFILNRLWDFISWSNWNLMRFAFNCKHTKRFVDWPEGGYGQWRLNQRSSA